MVNMEMDKYLKKMMEKEEAQDDLDQSMVMSKFQKKLLEAEKVEGAAMVKQLKRKSAVLGVRKNQSSATLGRRMHPFKSMKVQDETLRHMQSANGVLAEPLSEVLNKSMRIKSSKIVLNDPIQQLIEEQELEEEKSESVESNKDEESEEEKNEEEYNPKCESILHEDKVDNFGQMLRAQRHLQTMHLFTKKPAEASRVTLDERDDVVVDDLLERDVQRYIENE